MFREQNIYLQIFQIFPILNLQMLRWNSLSKFFPAEVFFSRKWYLRFWNQINERMGKSFAERGFEIIIFFISSRLIFWCFPLRKNSCIKRTCLYDKYKLHSYFFFKTEETQNSWIFLKCRRWWRLATYT